MRKMKDSGIEWIGKIPDTWNVIRLKNASWLKGRIGWQGLRAEEFTDEGPFLITGTDFKNGYVNWNTCVHISEQRFNQDLAIHIKENDLLITKDGTIGKLAIAKNCPKKVSLNSGVFIIRNTGKYKYDDKFMYYLLQSREFTLWFDLSNAGNSTICHLNQEKFYNFKFAYPSLPEQKKIADFLDGKCAD
jgi:type I restriction enzyme S subunit